MHTDEPGRRGRPLPPGTVQAGFCALAPAMFLLAPACAPFVSLHHSFFYHQDGFVAPVILALLLNILVLWLVLAAVFTIAERWRAAQVFFWFVLLLVLPWLLLHDYALITAKALPHPLLQIARFGAVAVFLLGAVLWKVWWRPFAEKVLPAVKTMMTFAAFGSLITVVQLGWYAWIARGINAPRPLHISAPVARAPEAGPPLVVWIIFDELGYRPTFVERPADLALPAFDSLAAQSFVFTAAHPPSNYTEQVIPALLYGDPSTVVRFSSSGSLLLRRGASASFMTADPQQTVFADALRLGYSTAASGWFNPYCRVFASVLDRCFFSSRQDSVTLDFDTRATWTTNALGPLHHAWKERHPLAAYLDHMRAAARSHIEDLQLLTAAADQMLADRHVNFLLLHLPIPHPAGIYNRRTASLDATGTASYADNLVLADRVLAHFRRELEQQGRWDNSAVLVMGDHGWRTSLLWRNATGWTGEDEAVSQGGLFDPRPAYLVKLPGQHATVGVNETFATTRTRQLLDAIMQGQLKAAHDLQFWLAHP